MLLTIGRFGKLANDQVLWFGFEDDTGATASDTRSNGFTPSQIPHVREV